MTQIFRQILIRNFYVHNKRMIILIGSDVVEKHVSLPEGVAVFRINL